MVELDEAAQVVQKQAAQLVALDDALTDLAAIDPRKSQIVEMRYFGGMSVEETAEVLGVSGVTVMREWGTAKAWLLRAISTNYSAKK
jgi:RNA polymerase sigma factor (sigma-70 family)